MKYSKLRGLLVILIIYIAILCFCGWLYGILNFQNNYLKLFILILIAGMLVFVFSLIFNNSLIFKPFWGFAPSIASLVYVVINECYSVISVTLLSLICLWGFMQIVNFVLTFKNLNCDDPINEMLKEKGKIIYFIVNLLLNHLLPALVIDVALAPAFYIFIYRTGSFMSFIAFFIMFIGILIEVIADFQMYLHKKNASNQELVMNHGLWSRSRHPNYFGEIIFWIGLFLVYFSIENPSFIFVSTPLVIFAYIEFARLPLMEKYELSVKPAYKEYLETTNKYLPF